MKKLLLIIFIVASVSIIAQPANDDCSGATNLGTLPDPGACTGTTLQSGTTVTQAGTIVGATPENPYVIEAPCSGGTQASPANDVWYSFVAPANGFGVNVVATSTFATPNIALWTGTCAGMQGVTCVVGAGGSATINITSQLVPGQTYFMQISGATGETGTFNIQTTALNDCSGCLESSGLTVSPLPVNGMYQPGQTVSFCFHVAQWMEVGNNWLHGVQLAFGSGWNVSSLITTPPPPVYYTTTGSWAYYPTGITSNIGPTHWPAGFYFDSDDGGCFCIDGNPGDNYGDGHCSCLDTQTPAQWDFCWTITVNAACNPGASLSVIVNTSGDGESGGYSTPGCGGDASTTFDAIQACCPPTIAVTEVLCNGQSTGSATATAVVGGAGNQDPYVFNWSGGATASNTVAAGTSNSLPNLPAGTYTVTVTDKNLCAATATATITQSTAISTTLTPTNITCTSTGGITTTVSGGTSPYTFAWIGPSAYSSTTQSPTGLTTAGVYSLTVTDFNSCTFTTTATIAQTGTITVTVNSPTICQGNSTTLTAGGATTYSWTPSTGLSATTGASVTANPTVTTTYTIVGTTGTCTNSATSVVTVNTPPTVTVNSATICPGASTTLTANGASTYTWTPSTTLSSSTGASVTANPTVTTTYTITGTSVAGCTATATSVVTIGGSITPTVNSATICAGSSTTLTAGGATTYTWSPGTGLSATTGASVTANPTSTTTYTITGASGGCTGTVTSVVTVNPIPVVTASSTSVCAGSAGTITAGGATTYSWITGETTAAVTESPATTTSFTVIGTTAGCTNTAVGTVSVVPNPTVTVNNPTICTGGTATLTGVGATTYSWSTSATTNPITVTPPTGTTSYTVIGTTNSCTNTAVATVTVVPSLLVTSSSATICAGNTATLTANGATTYSWNTGATSNPLTISPGITTTYTVIGTAGTCTASGTGVVTVNALPNITANTSTICVGQQTATLTASGASTYTWSPSATLSSNTGTTVTGTPTTTTGYVITGTDANGCINTGTTSVTVNTLPTITATSGTICVGEQTATLTANGASTYTWAPATGLTPTTGSVVVANPSSTQNYTITGTDANGCINTGITSVVVNSLSTITATSGTICVGQQTATLTAGGAVTYTWNSAATLSSNTGTTVTGTPTTTTNYTVTGTDGNGCKDSTTTTIIVNSLPPVTATSYTICVGQQTATLTASGAVTYTWNPSTTLSSNTGTTVTGTPTTTTSYVVTGTDANGCMNTFTTNINVNPLPLPMPTSNTPCANQTLTLTCAPNGLSNYNWAGPNSYSVSSTQNPVITGVTASTAGIYTVFVTDANNCTNSNTVTVIVNPLPVVSAVGSTVCVNQTITLSCLPNGEPHYSWQQQAGLWNSPFQNPTIPAATNTISGTYNYNVIVTDSNGCMNAGFAQVLVNPLPIISATSSTICIGQQTGTLTASGGTTYVWTPSTNLNSSTGTTVWGSPLATTIYTVTGTDANGCKDTATTYIAVLALPVVVTNTISPDCIPLCAVFTDSSTPTASTYTWNFGNGQTSIQPSPSECYTVSGTYQVMLNVTDINGCRGAANAISVTAFAIPVADFEYGQQPVSILAPEVNFTNLSTPGLPHYNWNFGDIYGSATTNTSTVTNPSHIYSDTGTYYVTLTVSTISGCSASVTKPILINEMFALYVPNAFSPNADGKNEIFLAEGEGITQFKMYIFDRWGLLIYYSDDINKGWDGTYIGKGTQILQEDVYVWKIQATDFTNTPRNLHGTVTLLK
ncbi:MAG: PKD domain-containing protein [Bacteroidia bacterium]